ncbi:MAG: hypothetical protein ACPGWS_10295 [Solirubrobacterales bacterium]
MPDTTTKTDPTCCACECCVMMAHLMEVADHDPRLEEQLFAAFIEAVPDAAADYLRAAAELN